MGEARRVEQDIYQKRKVRMPKKILSVAGEKLSEDMGGKLNVVLERYPGLRASYGAALVSRSRC